MKRILSLTLVLFLLGALMLPLASCALVKTKIYSGTEAAKLLLANERLDESLLGSNLSFLSKFSSSAKANGNTSLGLIEVYGAGNHTPSSLRVGATTRPGFTNVASDEHTYVSCRIALPHNWRYVQRKLYRRYRQLIQLEDLFTHSIFSNSSAYSSICKNQAS